MATRNPTPGAGIQLRGGLRQDTRGRHGLDPRETRVSTSFQVVRHEASNIPGSLDENAFLELPEVGAGHPGSCCLVARHVFFAAATTFRDDGDLGSGRALVQSSGGGIAHRGRRRTGWEGRRC